jgi:hypothetical protein
MLLTDAVLVHSVMVYLPCRHVLWIHAQSCPEVLLKLIRLLFREAVGQLEISVLYKMFDLLLRELILMFCPGHLVFVLNR